MRKTGRKGIVLFSAAGVVCVLAILTVVILNMKQETVYAVIDGEKVYNQEMSLYLTEERAAAAQYFMQKYDITDMGEDFWTTEYGGTTPAAYVTEKAVLELRADKAFFKECTAVVGAEKTTFESLKSAMENENETRYSARQNGETVYGVSEYTLATYLDYYKSNLTIKLREELKKNGTFTDDEVDYKSYYNTVKESDPLFKNDDGSYKDYGDVRAKVIYLYTEKQYKDYISKLVEKQKVSFDEKAVTELLLEIEK